jgi:MFS family permease
LWHHPAFTRLWTAQILSNAGSAVSAVAFPLIAVVTLDATPAQMGLLNIAGSFPNIFFSLFVGVWVDRMRRRPTLVLADLGRAILLGLIPLTALFGHLTFVHLVVVDFAVTTLSSFFTLASISVLPSLVQGRQLVEANSKLTFSDSVISIAGPSLGGGLVQLVTAPLAIALDALSYLVSGLLLSGLSISEASAGTATGRVSIWAQIAEGVHELVHTPLLRALTVSIGVGAVGLGIQNTVLVLFLTHDLGFTPVVIGLVFACGGVGSLLGAVVAARIARRVRIGRAITLGVFVWASGTMIMPLAGLLGPTLLFAGVGQLIAQMGASAWSINQMSLRQRVTPTNLLGRVTAARRVLLFGMTTLGAAFGGALGGMIGLRPTLIVGAMSLVASFVLTYLSPIRHSPDLPAAARDA